MDKEWRKCSKDELVVTCEKLQKKLIKYESRLSALVEAYKNLIDEKKTLEDTITSLSRPSNSPYKTLLDIPPTKVSLDDPLGASLSPDTPHPTTSCDNNAKYTADDIKSLEDKICALSNSLQSLNESKSKNEAIYQNDKKSMLSKHKKEVGKLLEEKESSQQSEKEMKCKLCQEQKERERDQLNNSSILKELQLLVETERMEKEELKLQLSEKISKDALLEYSKKIDELTNELQEVKLRLAKAELHDDEPEKQIKYLSEQVQDIKSKHSHDLIIEQKKSIQAEEMLKSRQVHEERRVAELESRLTDLSSIVGNYDKQRQNDQLLIQDLQQKLHTFDEVTTDKKQSKDDEVQVSDLHEQLFKLKSLLKISVRKSDQNLQQRMSSSDIDELLSNDPAHHACQEEYKQLKNEFEFYKRKNTIEKHSGKDSQSEDVLNYKKKIEALEDLLKQQELMYEQNEKEQLSTITRLQIELTHADDSCNFKVDDVKNEYKKYLEQADEELKKQRNRMLLLINEKELEVDRLKEKLFNNEDSMISFNSLNKQNSIVHDVETAAADEILLASPNSVTAGGNNLFHFNQQVCHLEMELSQARSHIHELEGAVRDAEVRENQVITQMKVLKEEIRRLERNSSRESANLEYLKNVCLQFILSDAYSVKSQMLSAMSTILKFSPEEMSQIEKKRQSWWTS